MLDWGQGSAKEREIYGRRGMGVEAKGDLQSEEVRGRETRAQLGDLGSGTRGVLTDGGRGWGFVGDEAAGFVGAVAEGSLGGLAAAAEGDGRLMRRDFEFCAAGIDEPERAFDDERAVGPEADGDVGHGCSCRAPSEQRGARS